ncbi:MFS transporter [Hwanghaeella grinnelliae]|uniref:MFS transporter n=1 Tax=Hwanghaeella grinnelliae TaxID=2500179 RepID=A0A3S3UMM5_9PROT|nr:MFS transporter [Hwanghaeella grinnelliae]RVU35075.1 MFS transporter [Hwanghaeella grinnelliae]
MTAITTDTDAGSNRLPYWFSAGHLCIDWPFGAMYLLVPAAGVYFGWSPAQVGLILTLQSVGAAFAYLPAGLMMDRLSERGRWLAATFFWVVLGYLLASYAGSFWPLAMLMAFASLGDAAWHPMATGILVKMHPHQRGRVLGIHAIGGTLTGVFSPLVAGSLLEFMDWRGAMQLVVIPTAIMGFVFLLYVAKRIPRVEVAHADRPNLKLLLRQWGTPIGATIAVTMMLYNLGLIGATAMAPLYLRDAVGLDIFHVGLAFSGAVLVGALIQPYVGRLSDDIGRWPVIVIGALLGAGGAMMLIQSSDLIFALIGLAGCIGALNAVRSCVLACAVDMSGKSEATTLGIAFAVLDGVGAFGAVMAGWLGTEDISRAFILTLGCSSAAAILSLILARISHKAAIGR